MVIPIDDDIKHIVAEGGSFHERRDRTGSTEYSAIELVGYALYREHNDQIGLLDRILRWVANPREEGHDSGWDIRVILDP